MSDYFCFDENISTHIVELLIHLKVNGSHITAHYPPGTKDEVLIPFICGKGWILVTGDPKMRKTHAAILQQHKIKALFLPDKFVENGLWHQCWWIFKYWPAVQDAVKKNRSFGHARITDNGKLVDL